MKSLYCSNCGIKFISKHHESMTADNKESLFKDAFIFV